MCIFLFALIVCVIYIGFFIPLDNYSPILDVTIADKGQQNVTYDRH